MACILPSSAIPATTGELKVRGVPGDLAGGVWALEQRRCVLVLVAHTSRAYDLL